MQLLAGRAALSAWVLMAMLAPLGGELRAESAAARGSLDGMVFEGKIGAREAPDLDDRLHFADGKFWSAICIRCGFEPGAYWTRVVGDSIHFRGELQGERGTFVYRGVISDDHANVDIHWTKRRWYWTIDRDMAFRGNLMGSRVSVSVDDAMRVASDALQAELPAACR